MKKNSIEEHLKWSLIIFNKKLLKFCIINDEFENKFDEWIELVIF